MPVTIEPTRKEAAMATTYRDDPLRLVLRVLDHRSGEGLTADQLARTIGLPVSTVTTALGELVAVGLVRVDDDEYLSTLQLD
jgi:DNA-binding IclR family transcriptional regulator